jgi:3',5'-cyclic AMP phosphodiesterase CpdA
MKIGVCSDLHLEFRNSIETAEILDLLNNTECDHLVLAGDVAQIDSDWFLKDLTKPYTFVTGNHDYYGGFLSSCKFETEEMVCATLWTNFWGGKGEGFKDIADSVFIGKDPNDPMAFITPQDLIDLNKEHVAFFQNSKKTIAISHFPPSLKSLLDKYAGSPLNPYFINNQDHLLKGKKLWICAHTHHKHSYIQHDCQVICNPLGYPGEIYSSIKDYRPIILETKDYA